MQFKSFHWLAITPYSTNMLSAGVTSSFGAFYFYFSFLYIGGVFNKTVTPLTFVGYEMIIANSALCTCLVIYSTRARGIIVKYVV